MMATNGIIHSIDGVISDSSETPLYENVFEALQNDGNFGTLVDLVTTLELEDSLTKLSEEGMTIFAPTDEAFEKLPIGTLEEMSPEQQKNLILRHLIAEKIEIDEIPFGPLETLSEEIISLVNLFTILCNNEVNFNSYNYFLIRILVMNQILWY